MAIQDTDMLLINDGGLSYQIAASDVFTLSGDTLVYGNHYVLVNEGPKSYACTVSNLQTKNSSRNGVKRILLVMRGTKSYQVTLEEFMNKYGAFANPGEILYTGGSTYIWTVPDGVRSISAIAIGGGGGGGAQYFAGGGGGGGALAYRNNYPVKPGEQFKLQAGQGGKGVTANEGGIGRNGTESRIIQNQYNLDIVSAGGGKGGKGNGNIPGGIGHAGGAGGVGNSVAGQTRYKGGAGGMSGNTGDSNRQEYPGGGGAAGTYAGNGALGENGDQTVNIYVYRGGGPAGGASYKNLSQGGGGINPYGQGSNGVTPGAGGSGGVDGNRDGTGGRYGGGGGGVGYDSMNVVAGDGGNGVVRIIWPGDLRMFPSTRTEQE